MLTSIAPREQPAKGPTTALDQDICRVLSGGGDGLEPRQIQEHLSAVTLPQIYARLRVLVSRGVLVRAQIPGGPLRGPGAGRYYKA